MSIFKTCIALIIIVFIVMFVYKMCVKTYDFGYRIFAEEPMSPAPGYKVSVAIVEGKSVMEIGEILKSKGLIRSAYLFYLQEMVSNYHGKLQPGVYDLSTAMTPDEMMAIMSAVPEEGDMSLEQQISSESDENTYIEGTDSGYMGEVEGTDMTTSGENEMGVEGNGTENGEAEGEIIP